MHTTPSATGKSHASPTTWPFSNTMRYASSPGMGLVGTSSGQPSGAGAVRTGVANIGVKGLYFQRSDFRVGTGKSAMA